MPTLSPCPDAAVLQNLVDGQLPSDILEALVKHLDQCHDCAELIRALAAQSTQNVRLENTEELSVPPELVAVIAELRQLPNQQSTTSGADPLQESQPVVLDNGTKQYQLPDKLERIAHYHIRTILGRGGMGYVFLAHDTHLDRQVALKVLRPDLAARRQAKERFLREARLAARLKSEHIITIYQVGEENGIPFLAMELLQGCTLYSLLEQEGRIGLERAVRIARQIAQGLAVAHEHGLVHRDVKPGNIWIEPHNGERVKLLDFGLARLHEEGESLTETGAILGTPAYMAPEQACGEKVDARADLWSLGVILYELTTGRKPFTGSNTLAVLSRIALEQPVPPQALNPDLPSELSTLILRLLEKEPAKRPASAREVIAVLTAIESYGSIETLPNIKSPPLIQTPTFPSPNQNERTPSARPTRRQPRWWATAAIGLVFAPLAYFLGGTLIRIATNQGELLVEVDDPTIELRIVQNGVIVQDRTSQREFTLTAGKGEIEVYEKNGVGPLTTRQFVLNRGGKTTVRVSWQELADARKSVPAPPPSDKKTAEDDQSPDRRAALYVISVGGVVHVEGIPQTITDAKQLPTGNFRLTQVGLRNCYRMSSDGLAVFSECQHLTHLYMFETGATDAGLAHFKKCKNLIMLEVSVNAGVTDAGLAHFKGCPLKHLGVASTQVTDAGLAHFQNCKELEYIDFSNTSVTDVGLAYFKNCQHLGHLSLQSTKISDAGLVHFAQFILARVVTNCSHGCGASTFQGM
ncbi:MAG: protein kinase [Thermogemmata sp.]|nr:protein kinase [Thermogemmata sp.]